MKATKAFVHWFSNRSESNPDLRMDVIMVSQMSFKYWLVAWLCAHYCISITSFSYKLFILIKRSLPGSLPYVLFLSGVVSLGSAWVYYLGDKLGSPPQHPLNLTQSASFSKDEISLYNALGSFFGYGLPFTKIVISLLVTVSSLMKHVHNIGHTGSNIQIHISAIKTMVMFLIFFVLCYILQMYLIVKEDHFETVEVMIIWMIFQTFPTAEALIIIWSNPKFRKTFPRWF
ncbi:taste receptor type 2 member 40-like [Hyperolius riggenbachi]|uniref:taste receptor type 2 member 40-like n=1 Tax=Hyperolius riggenbachi TaxID=752182 RepID=UPI0035A34AE8